MPTLLRDLRYALRQLRKSPGFAITAIVTLALGIGANVVVFSVLNALVLKPLNVRQPERLYNIARNPNGAGTQSYPDYLDYKKHNSTLSGIAAYNIQDATIGKGKSVARSTGYEVSGNYFDLLGVQPMLGRLFHTSDERGPNSAPYIVLSNGFWRSHFHGDPRIVGDTVEVNQHPYTVLGIAPKEFHGTESFLWPTFWVPMVNEEQIEGYNYLENRGDHSIWTLAKLKRDVNVQQASDDLNVIAKQLRKEYPEHSNGHGVRLVKPGLMGDEFGRPIRAFMTGIMALALLVLLAACANLGSIFAARAADRSRELTIRLAVGSTYRHILRQLLTESVLISILGGIGGTFFANFLLGALSRWQPFAAFPVHITVYPDLRVYTVALLLAVGSGILFGLLPARQIWRADAAQMMKSGASAMPTFRRFALRDVLLTIQIALCTLLVTASLVAVRGMIRSLHAPLGFQPNGVVLASGDLYMAGNSADQSLPVQKHIIEAVSRIPGVTAVGVAGNTPLTMEGGDLDVYREGTTIFRPSQSIADARFYPISPGYLHAAETKLLTGRDFTWDDDTNSPKVAVVNETFARKMFGNSSAIGRRFLNGAGTPYRVVGVVQDWKYDTLTEDPRPAMFLPLAQNTDSDTTVVVRSHLTPAEMAAALHRVLSGIEPNLPFTIQSWRNSIEFIYLPAQVAAAALGIMGLLAAMLAITGIFGMAAYSVSKQMKELGIRIALGAQPAQLMRSALGRPLTLLLSGSIAGLVLGVLASRLLAQIVYEATPRDPVVLAGVVVAMTLLGALATWIPARRALHIDPNQLLHEE